MNIWHFTALDPNAAGGVEKHIAGLTGVQKARGHKIYIGKDNPPFSAVEPYFVHTHGDCWPTSSFIKKIKSDKKSIWIQTCHGTSIGRLIACNEYLSRSAWRGTARDYTLARLADALIVVSAPVLTEVKKYFRINKPSAIIPNGVDPNVFKPLDSITTAPKLIFLGRADDAVKNIDNLLEASGKVYASHPDFELWLAPGLSVGGQADYPFVKNLGKLDGIQIPNAIAKCRALILCSLYEGDGIVLREAQAMGLPVIASDLPSIRENIGDYPAGYFVDPKNPNDIATKIEQSLYNDGPQTPNPKVRTWTDAVNQLDEFYKTLDSSR